MEADRLKPLKCTTALCAFSELLHHRACQGQPAAQLQRQHLRPAASILMRQEAESTSGIIELKPWSPPDILGFAAQLSNI